MTKGGLLASAGLSGNVGALPETQLPSAAAPSPSLEINLHRRLIRRWV